MPIDPQLEPLLGFFEPFMDLDWATLDVAAARQMTSPMPPSDNVEMAAVRDLRIATPEGGIDGRIYYPTDEARAPVILFLHGGGWVLGTIDDYDLFARVLARESGCTVLSVAYRLAPEHPYPAAPEDGYAALQWIAAHGEELNIDPQRIALAGDSAGGNLSAAVAVMARDRGGPALRHQALLYPVTDMRCDTPSFRDNQRYLLTPEMMRWYWRRFIGDRPVETVPLASPAHYARLDGLPPATIITAEYDPLRDEGEAYALALSQAGVPTETVRVAGMIHGFATMIGVISAAEKWVAYTGRRLAQALRD